MLRAPSESAATLSTVTSTGRPGFERGMQAARAFRLDADDLHAAAVPGRDPGDQSAAADRDQHGVEVGRILLPFEPDGALPGDRLGGVIGMHRQRAALRDEGVAGSSASA